MTRDPIVAATEAHIAREGAGAEAVERAYRNLQGELLDALEHDPGRRVSTPGWRSGGTAPAVQVVIDDAHSEAGLQDLITILRIAGEMSRSLTTPVPQRLALMAALAGIASRHAAQHAEEASWG
jgi:hypothetical protein